MASSAAILAINLVRPFHHDNAIYQSIAWQWVRYGRLPYIGSMDNNFPGIIYFHAISCLIFGNSEIGFRIIETTLQLLVAALMFALMRRWYSSRAAFMTAVLSSEIYLSGGEWSAGQRDSFAVLMLLLALVVLFQLRDAVQETASQFNLRQKYPTTVWAHAKSVFIGMALGMTVLLRPTYGLFCIAVIFSLLSTFGKERWRFVASFSTGFFAVLALAMLPYLAIPGAFRSIYLATIRLNAEVYGTSAYRRTPWEGGAWKHWLFVVGALGASIGLSIYGKLNKKGRLGSPAYQRICRADFVLFVMLCLGAVLSLFLMGKYFRTHFQPIYQFSIVLIATAVERIVIGLRPKILRGLSMMLVVVVGAGFLYSWNLLYALAQATTHHVHDPIESVAEYIYPDTLWGYAKQRQLASYIQHNTLPGDRNELTCADPWLSYRTGLQIASRFIHIVHLVIKKPDGTYATFQKEWQSEYLDSLRKIRPKFFVTAFGPTPKTNEFLPDVPYRALEAIPGYDSVLRTYYRYDTTIGWWLVYRRKD